MVWSLDGTMEIAGEGVARYWCGIPFDHVYARYVKRCADGSIGAGAQISNLEYLGRGPCYQVQVTAIMERLDDEIFIHEVLAGGMHMGRMEHTFEQVSAGTRFGHILFVPGKPMRVVDKMTVPFFWARAKGVTWLRRATGEMGNPRNFLPGLYESEAHTGNMQ